MGIRPRYQRRVRLRATTPPPALAGSRNSTVRGRSQVIENLHAKNFPGLSRGPRKRRILVGRLRVTRRMVERYNGLVSAVASCSRPGAKRVQLSAVARASVPPLQLPAQPQRDRPRPPHAFAIVRRRHAPKAPLGLARLKLDRASRGCAPDGPVIRARLIDRAGSLSHTLTRGGPVHETRHHAVHGGLWRALAS